MFRKFLSQWSLPLLYCPRIAPFRGPEWRSLEPGTSRCSDRQVRETRVKSDAPEAKKKNNMCGVRIDPFGAHLEMSEPTTARIEAGPEPLSRAEIEIAVGRLTAGDQTALILIAKHHARNNRTRYEYEDLVHEAICRVLDGRRAWPRDVPATVFLGGVIRSIAWEWKRDLLNEEVEAGDEGAVERGTLAKIDVKKIIALFDDDPIAQEIVIGMMDGARGEELEQASGLSPTEYESKRKKIRRRIEKLKT